MEQSAIVSIHVTPRAKEPATVPVAPPVEEQPWHLRFPGTAAALARLNAEHEEIEAKRQASLERQRKVEELRRQRTLARTPEGRIQLAREATARTRAFDEARRKAREEQGLGSAATDANRNKRAEAKEAAIRDAQRKKADQESQGRGGGGGKKDK